MPRNVTGALMGDPGFGASPAAHAFEPSPRPWPKRAADADMMRDIEHEPGIARLDPRRPRTLRPPIAEDPAMDAPREDPEFVEGGDRTSNEQKVRSYSGQAADALGVHEKTVRQDLRPVAPIKSSTCGLEPGQRATPPPFFMDVAPTELLVDGAYQRDLSDRSLRLIARIVEAWDWRRFKPPVCAWTDAGLVIIDGQHTAIAAATHGGFPTIPIMVVEAADAAEQASAFVGHNRDRLALHATQIHRAAVAAGEPEAVELERVVATSGASIVRNPYGSKVYKVGDTIAVTTIANLIRDSGEEMATTVLRLLVEGGCGLISKDQIRATVELLTQPNYADEFAPADLPAAIRKAADTAEKDAKLFAADHCTPYWRGLVNVWFRAVKKRRAV